MTVTRFQSLAGESRRNVATSPLRSFIHGAVLASLIVASSLLDAVTIAGLERQAEIFRAAGGATRVLSSPAGVERDLCERLPATAGFAASGSLAQGESTSLVAAGSSTLPVYEISPGLASRLGIVDSGQGGVYLATTFAAELGADRGTVLMTQEGDVTVLGTFAPGPREGGEARLSSALVSIVPPAGRASECWADTWPATRDRDPLLLTTLSPDASPKDTSLDALNPVAGQRFPGAETFAGRATRYTPALAAAGALLLGIVYSRSRRLELAGSLHAGASRSFVMGTMLGEATLVGLPAAASAALTSSFLAPLLHIAMRTLLPVSALPAVITVTMFALGVATAASTVRESDLFVLFKAR